MLTKQDFANKIEQFKNEQDNYWKEYKIETLKKSEQFYFENKERIEKLKYIDSKNFFCDVNVCDLKALDERFKWDFEKIKKLDERIEKWVKDYNINEDWVIERCKWIKDVKEKKNLEWKDIYVNGIGFLTENVCQIDILDSFRHKDEKYKDIDFRICVYIDDNGEVEHFYINGHKCGHDTSKMWKNENSKWYKNICNYIKQSIDLNISERN